ncbi:hypothetical protein SFSGTM_25650 [Sulfuriferula nivalis]|uniref:Uncharacterized protein n=1 Tax=Sulfuriferula nivalis TaxID=2675298 RepID=A0A809SF01_9PROT|nr:hypothetical protein SFSGTM_25650 [Sulfuriferula nivalis]
MLNHFLDKFLQKPDIESISPISTVGAAQKWVLGLTKLHEYDAHQQIIKILKLYNQGHPPFDPQRLHILSIIEQAGSKYQHGLITQFLTNHANLEYAGKSLWKEIVNFYWQMALSYQVLTNAALHGGEQGSAALSGLVLRSIHYQGKLIQWRYLRYELPTAQIWHSIHKLYRIAEQHGFAHESLVLKGSAYCSCEQAYARVLLLHLMHPVGLSPNELELAAYWAWKWRDALKLDKKYLGNEHTYCVALADSLPPQPTYGNIIELESARYFSMQAVINQLIQAQAMLTQRQKNIKLYGVPFSDDPNLLLNHIHTQFTYVEGNPALNQVNLLTEINIIGCKPELIPALTQPEMVQPLLAYHEAAGHPIEHYYRLNLPSNTLECPIQQHDLVLIYNESKTKIASVAAVRWMEISASKITTLGLEQLGITPQLVTLCEVRDVFAPRTFMNEHNELAFPAMYLSQSSNLVALHAIDGKYYDMLMDDYVYRIRIHARLEHQYDWLRAKFNMLTRTHLTRLSTSPI